jgi:hypothetical protein
MGPTVRWLHTRRGSAEGAAAFYVEPQLERRGRPPQPPPSASFGFRKTGRPAGVGANCAGHHERLMPSARIAVVAASVALVSAVAVEAAPRGEPTVGCEQIALRARSGVEDGFRVLLGAVSVPGSQYIAAEAVRTHQQDWPYFRNAGLAVRAGTVAVRVEVPEGWRDRIALSWGGSPTSTSVRFAACPAASGRVWNAYAGGFYLRSQADCVPLHVRVGGTSTTVRVGVGRACGAS